MKSNFNNLSLEYGLKPFSIARQLVKDEKIEEAIDIYRQAIKFTPNINVGWYRKLLYHQVGELCVKCGRLDDASTAFRQAFGINPNSAISCFSLAEVLHKQGKIRQAAAFYYRGLCLQPNNKFYQNKLNQILYEGETTMKSHPVLIYQMGKVGSQSILNVLQKNGLEAYHIHHCQPNNRNSNFYEKFVVQKQPVNIICLYRNPIEKNISQFFQDYGNKMAKNIEPVYSKNHLLNIFLNKGNHLHPINWFDNEIKKNFNIDIYYQNANHSQIIEKDHVRLLILNYHATEREKVDCINNFLKIQVNYLPTINNSDKKEYWSLYEKIYKQVDLPISYVKQLLNTKYFYHFFTNDQISKEIEKWCCKKWPSDIIKNIYFQMDQNIRVWVDSTKEGCTLIDGQTIQSLLNTLAYIKSQKTIYTENLEIPFQAHRKENAWLIGIIPWEIYNNIKHSSGFYLEFNQASFKQIQSQDSLMKIGPFIFIRISNQKMSDINQDNENYFYVKLLTKNQNKKGNQISFFNDDNQITGDPLVDLLRSKEETYNYIDQILNIKYLVKHHRLQKASKMILWNICNKNNNILKITAILDILPLRATETNEESYSHFFDDLFHSVTYDRRIKNLIFQDMKLNGETFWAYTNLGHYAYREGNDADADAYYILASSLLQKKNYMNIHYNNTICSWRPLSFVNFLDHQQNFLNSKSVNFEIEPSISKNTKIVHLVSGDFQYIKRFLPISLASSLNYAEEDFVFHVHVVNPDEEISTNLKTISSFVPHLGVSTRQYPQWQMQRPRLAAERFLMVEKILEKYQLPVIITDIDIAMKRKWQSTIRNKLGKTDFALARAKQLLNRTINRPWSVNAQTVYIAPSPLGLKFATLLQKYVEMTIDENSPPKLMRSWLEDQGSLSRVTQYIYENFNNVRIGTINQNQIIESPLELGTGKKETFREQTNWPITFDELLNFLDQKSIARR